MPRSIARKSRAISSSFRCTAPWLSAVPGEVAVGSGVLRRLGYQFELVDHPAELGKRTGLHLPHRSTAMDLDRGFGNADIAGNLFAEAALCNLNHDLAFPWAQGREALPECGQSLLILSSNAVAREAELDGVE